MLLHYSINIANACVTQWVSTHNRHSIHMEQCEINVKINAVSVDFPRHSMFGIINMQLIVVVVWFGPTLHRKLIEISWETKKLLPNRQIEFPIAQFFSWFLCPLKKWKKNSWEKSYAMLEAICQCTMTKEKNSEHQTNGLHFSENMHANSMINWNYKLTVVSNSLRFSCNRKENSQFKWIIWHWHCME